MTHGFATYTRQRRHTTLDMTKRLKWLSIALACAALAAAGIAAAVVVGLDGAAVFPVDI